MSAMETETWIGVDVGSVRVGVAVTDPGGTFALPLDTFDRDEAIPRIVDLMEERETANVVVGWPLELDGAEGQAVHKVRAFLEELKKEVESRGRSLQVEKVDERLTTSLAEVMLDEAEVRGRRRRQVVDRIAAQQILKAFLEVRAANGPSDAE